MGKTDYEHAIQLGWDGAVRRHYGDRLSIGANALTEEEWLAVVGFLPKPMRRGRPRTTDLRAVLDAILYMAWTGCQWRALPPHFPPVSTVRRYFYAWRDSGLWTTINFHLVQAARLAAGREASPTAGIIDSQSAKATEVPGPRGYDGGKKVKGRKRHIVTDTQGNLLGVKVHTRHLFEDKASGARDDGPGLQSCLDDVKVGDTLVV